jgi:hypothetical protein
MTHWGTVTALQKAPALGSEPVALEVKLERSSAEDQGSKLATGIKELYQKCQFYDLLIVAAGSRFPAHKAALAAMSGALSERVRQACAKFRETADTGTSGTEAGGPLVESRGSYPELHLPDISSPEAAKALLDFVYSLGSGYSVSSDEVNRDVLRLAKEFELPLLEDHASRQLTEGLSTANVIARLATCEEFGLDNLYGVIADELMINIEALVEVSNSEEILRHPKILQSLLIRAARLHNSAAVTTPSKRVSQYWAPLEGRAEKVTKVAAAGA